jgi:hypothetical protein
VETEAAWRSLQSVNEWVRYADSKATAVLAVDGLLLGLIALRVPSVDDLQTNAAKVVLLFAALACAVVSVLLSLMIVLPIDIRPGVGEERSLTRFVDVAAEFGTSRDDFVNSFLELVGDPARLRVDIARQIWSASVVGRRRYRLVAWSIGFLVGAIALTAAAGVATSLWG